MVSTLAPWVRLNSLSASKNHWMASTDVQRVPPHWSVGRTSPRQPFVDQRKKVDTLVFRPRRRGGTRAVACVNVTIVSWPRMI